MRPLEQMKVALRMRRIRCTAEGNGRPRRAARQGGVEQVEKKLSARRDLIVQFFDKEVAAKGEGAVLYDLPRSSETCGAGLQ